MTKSIHAYKGGAVRHRSSAFHINLTDNSEQSNNHYTNLRHESNNRLPTISAEAAAKLTKELRACHHPDGTSRFVRSALLTFAAEVSRHQRGQCTATSTKPFLPVPQDAASHETDWI